MSTENISEREGLERLESLVREKNFKEASAFASDLRERYPSSFQIGFLYYGILVNLQRYAESESVLDELLKLYPENINLLLEKGALLVGREKTAESKLFFEKVLFLDPFNSKAKEGLDRTRSSGSGSPAGFQKYERAKVILEDTMRESDLDRFMSDETNSDPGPEIVGEKDPEELDISLSESHFDFRKSLLEEDVVPMEDRPDQNGSGNEDEIKISGATEGFEIEDSTEITEDEIKTQGKVESALEELNRFSSFDLKDIGIDEKSEETSDAPETGAAISSEDTFITESAALLYLKQGLYEEAKSVYGKLYKGSNEDLFEEKVEKVNRIEKSNLKIIALERFLNKIRTGSVRSV